jgi:formylmethanofuran dehydrogenase subunit E
MCAVDAIQFLTGCTFGKGNLIHKDYGKNAFTFYRRSDGKAIRLVRRASSFGSVPPSQTSGDLASLLGKLNKKLLEKQLTDEEQKIWQETRGAIIQRIMELPLEDLFEIKIPSDPVPKKARIFDSLICASCGEQVMETRTRRFHDQVLCIPCFDAIEKRY